MANETTLILSFVTLVGNLGLKLYEAIRPKKRDPPPQERIVVYNVHVSINLSIENSPGVTIKVNGPESPTS